MMRVSTCIVPAAVLLALLPAAAGAQVTNDPFPEPIPATEGVIRVNFTEFATLPDVNGQPARMNIVVDEPGTRRLFVNDMRGPLYVLSYDGKTVSTYVDTNDARWAHPVQSQGRERGFQSFAFHPQFNQRGSRGYGKFYTLTDTGNMTPEPDFKPTGTGRSHDEVLLEWTAKNPAAATYDGDAPRELFRVAHPFPNHNGGQIAFNPTAGPRDSDYGLLYIAFADGGSGGDPYNMAQNLGALFGKILRIDPFEKNAANGKYGFPSNNPFASDNNPTTLGEIYAYGNRNSQRLFWDPKTKHMYMAEIGQNTVEEISQVTPGANLGWNVWEGSFKFVAGRGGGVDTSNPRSDPKITYPIVEYGQIDPLLQPQSAATGGVVYRQKTIPQLENLMIFGDNPSGELFYINADRLPQGMQSAIRRILLNDKGTAKTFLQVIKDKNAAQGRMPATRADLRFGSGPNQQIFLLNKQDGVIRLLVP